MTTSLAGMPPHPVQYGTMQHNSPYNVGMNIALDPSKISRGAGRRCPLDAARRWMSIALALAFSVAWSGPGPAFAEPVASDWVEGHNVRTRLIAGSKGVPGVVAGLEMELADGWKTYWRFPGDAGGVPPEFDWSGSTNVAQATVTYPAPMRMTDRAGNTIGYKKHVVFPVHVKPEHPDKPVTLKLQFIFGVCYDICVPSEGTYEITIPAGGGAPLPPALTEAMRKVPLNGAASHRPGGAPADDPGTSPRLAKIEAALDGDSPKLTMHVAFPKGTAGADVFVEGPPGEFVPLPHNKGAAGDNTLVFEIDFTEGADVAALAGKELRATIVSETASSETTFILK